MSGARMAFILAIIPIAIGLVYWALPNLFQVNAIDAAGATMLVALGLAMGFGFFVILRGARDL
jgi:hypothetical protein